MGISYKGTEAVARRTGRNKYRTRALTAAVQSRVPDRVKPILFLPDYPDQVMAIAMQGLTDDEMAALFGISGDLLQSWKEYYPSFSEAIEKGRTLADGQVLQALYKNAVGYEYETDEIVKTRSGAHVLTVRKKYLPETAAQKFWLENRQPENWGRKAHLTLGSKPGQPMALAVKAETKMEIINSILGMISPQPDPDPSG